jgi:hypothetical protein
MSSEPVFTNITRAQRIGGDVNEFRVDVDWARTRGGSDIKIFRAKRGRKKEEPDIMYTPMPGSGEAMCPLMKRHNTSDVKKTHPVII